MVKLQVLGNNSKTVNNIKNLTWGKNYQHIKIYLPCNFEVNLITHQFLPHVRFLILLTVFELLPKTCNFTICSIFSNSGHVGWCTASPDTILKLDTLVMIQTKFGFCVKQIFQNKHIIKEVRDLSIE
jgi:hypothetical protein